MLLFFILIGRQQGRLTRQAIPVSTCTIDYKLLLTTYYNPPRFKESLTALFVLSLRQETWWNSLIQAGDDGHPRSQWWSESPPASQSGWATGGWSFHKWNQVRCGLSPQTPDRKPSCRTWWWHSWWGYRDWLQVHEGQISPVNGTSATLDWCIERDWAVSYFNYIPHSNSSIIFPAPSQVAAHPEQRTSGLLLLFIIVGQFV